jgi:membrane protease YdiL (CAAX protease family)
MEGKLDSRTETETGGPGGTEEGNEADGGRQVSVSKDDACAIKGGYFLGLFLVTTMLSVRRISPALVMYCGGLALFCAAICFLGLRRAFRFLSTAGIGRACKYGLPLGAVFPTILMLSLAARHTLPAGYSAFGTFGVFGKLLLCFNVAGVWPIGEELLFRGYLYSMLRTRCRVLWATLLSNLLFAFIYPLSVGVLIGAFVRGLIFTWAYQKSGSVWGSILAHSMSNLPDAFFICLA